MAEMRLPPDCPHNLSKQGGLEGTAILSTCLHRLNLQTIYVPTTYYIKLLVNQKIIDR